MKYTINEFVFNDFNASSKAREDVSTIVADSGFEILESNDKRNTRNFIIKACLAIKVFFKMLVYLGHDDTVFLQTSTKILACVLIIKRIKNFKIVYLIHDMFCLRFTDKEKILEHESEIQSEIGMMNSCDVVIAHNDRMKQRLQERGCSARIYCLGIFDYLTNGNPPNRKLCDDENVIITFAGNLGKSPFLKNLDAVSENKFQLFVYGANNLMEFKNAHYMGRLCPEELPIKIKGHFGLIWEGDYDRFEDNNYLLINNPHKLSMYIVSELPVIAWDKSYAGEFVEKHNIGLTISSLDDLGDVRKRVDSIKYDQMVSNCKSLAMQLRAGNNLKSILSQLKDS